jgi:hypothetical protein
VNVGLFLLVFRVLAPRQIPTRQLVAGALVAGVAWQALQAVGGYLVGHYLRHTSQVCGVFAIVLGLLFWLYLGAQVTLYAAELNVVAARRLWPRSLLQPPLANADHPPQLTLPANSNPDPEEATRVDVTATSTPRGERSDADAGLLATSKALGRPTANTRPTPRRRRPRAMH